MPRLPLAALALIAAVFAFACSDDDANPPPFPDIILTATDSGTPTTSAHPTAPDLEPGTWTQLAPLPTPRSEVAVVEVGGLIYVVGGFEASGAPSTKVEVYDPATNSWASAPDLPRPRHHTAVAAWEGDLLVLGGFERGFDDPQLTVLRLNVLTQTWSEGPPLKEPRAAHAATTGSGNPSVVGGIGRDGDNLATGEWIDSLTEEWHNTFPLSAGRDHLAIAEVTCPFGGDDIRSCQYVIGGRQFLDFGRNVDTNEFSVSHGGVWKTLAPMPTARSGMAAAAVDNRIYVFGGEAPSGTFDTVEVYDPETNTWDTAEPMPTSRHGMGAAVVDGGIYVIGGGPSPGLSVTGANEAYKP